MRNPRLLDRQIDLLRALTNPELIFGGEKLADVAQDPSLHGISIPHLRLEAEMSFEKRIGKIGMALQQTFSCLGERGPGLFREFVATCPPTTYRRYDEALCFHDFLRNHWKSVPPTPPFIVDVVTFEIALAKIKVFRKAEDGASSIPAELEQRKPLIRLSQSADIVPLDYDLRGLFEKHASKVSPAKRPHCLLIVQLNRRRRPSVMEVSDAMKEILTRMVNWTVLEDVLETIGPDRSSLKDTLQTYLKSGILEVAQ
jgi:hypothetical protein